MAPSSHRTVHPQQQVKPTTLLAQSIWRLPTARLSKPAGMDGIQIFCSIEISQYLITKFNWTHNTPSLINWQIVDLTMRQFQSPDQTCIQKMIHKWVPIQQSPGNYPTEVQHSQCLTCCQHPDPATLPTVQPHKMKSNINHIQCNPQELSTKQ